MKKLGIAGLSFTILILFFMLVVGAYGAHDKIPDMQHGESVARSTQDNITVSGKVGGGDIMFKVKSAGNVTFSHDSHVKGVGLRCTDCHDKLFITRAKDKPVTMAQMRKGISCGGCHNGKKAFNVTGNCGNCHKK